MIKQTAVAGDVTMGYIRFGKGEKTFVILPGVDTKSVLLSAKAISAAYSLFAEEYTVYVFDRRQNMPGDYTVRQMADDTAAVMRSLGLRCADVFGASQGGMIALCLAIGHPELVHSMVLGSTAARVDQKVIAGTQRWIALAEAGDLTALTADFIDELYSRETIGRYRELLIHMNDHVGSEDIRRFIIQCRALEGFDVFEELEQIRCPVLVIGVEGDKVLPADFSRELAAKLSCELYLYGSEYGHCAFDEAQDYKQRLLDFFHGVV